MEPTTKIDESELQKAIDSIAGAGDAVAGVDAVAAVTDKVATDAAESGGAVEPVTMGEVVAVAEPVVEASTIAPDVKAAYGDPDLGAVKTKALTDLRPLVDKVEMSPESRFKIYREIIAATHDKAAIEPAYEAAVQIAVEKDKAEALLFIVDTIDGLGIAT